MNKQEAIEKIEKLEGLTILDKAINFDSEMIPKNKTLSIVRQLDEPEKPIVPQFVADWYEANKDDFEWGLYNLCVQFHKHELTGELNNWFTKMSNKSIETLVLMHKLGYEVEKEKLYTVEIPNQPNTGHLVLTKDNHGELFIDWKYTDSWKEFDKVKLTEAEIKKDFEWAWQFAEEVKE